MTFSNNNLEIMSSSEYNAWAAAFQSTLTSYFLQIRAGGIKKLTVSGPGILREFIFNYFCYQIFYFENYLLYCIVDDQVTGWFLLNKQRFLNEYVNVIRNMTDFFNSTDFQTEYIDIRAKYLDNIPLMRVAYPGFSFFKLVVKTNYYITYDGEHPNRVSTIR